MTFNLRVQYQGLDPQILFETECELLFRPRKNKTWVGRLSRKTVPRARASDAVRTIEQAPPAPERRPKVTPASYVDNPDGHEGLFLTNEGTPAYDVQVEPIRLNDDWSVTFTPISRLADDGFSEAFVSRENEAILSLWGLWRGQAGQPAILPLVIKYRDFGGRWYQSICELHRDVTKKSGFDVLFIRQE